MRQWLWLFVAMAIASGEVSHPSARQVTNDGSISIDPLHKPFDEVLDLNVRDGLVYYRTLQVERGKLDRYVASLNAPSTNAEYPKWPRERQIAFWLNAYNAFVLETVINRYPIRGSAPEYPANSIRQIPGAFDRIVHPAAGRRLTLDAIETGILSGFGDPRLLLALGRGAVGSPRLRSEAFAADRLERQLREAAAEFATSLRFIQVDRGANRLGVSPIIGWRQDAFEAAYGGQTQTFASRSPIERAVLAFIRPHLLPAEREFLDRDEFQMSYQEFDWHLNDLTGR